MRSSIDMMIYLVMCHLVGDYVLQVDFIAKTKGTNFYHLLVHCVLYCLPFFIFFGIKPWGIILFLSHVIVDEWKANPKIPKGKITPKWQYIIDQVCHYLILILLYYFITHGILQ